MMTTIDGINSILDVGLADLADRPDLIAVASAIKHAAAAISDALSAVADAVRAMRGECR